MKKILLILLLIELLGCAGGTGGTSFAGTSVRTKRGYSNIPKRRVYKPRRANRYHR